jgi:thermitase
MGVQPNLVSFSDHSSAGKNFRTSQENTPTESPTGSPTQNTTRTVRSTSTPPIVVIKPSQNTATSVPSTTAAPPPTLTGDFAPDEVLVKVDPRVPKNKIEQCLTSANATLKSKIDELDVLEVKIPTGNVANAISSLNACSGILYSEPNYYVRMADIIPDDPGWGNQYGLLAIHAPQGWDLSTGSTAVTIAIVDTGVDLEHVDLAVKIVPGFDFVNNDNNPQDDNGHGTHVAGIAAAATNNDTGIAGVSWGARIMPIKVLNSSGNGSFAEVAAGITWAADQGAQVINLSLGGSSPSSVLEDAVNYAYGKGIILVAAGGNSGSDSVLYPAAYPNVIAVAATDGSNNHASFSDTGPEIDVVAPGVSIYSTALGNTYGYLSGTSLSTPFVSGLAAILRGLPSNTSPAKITQEIESTALDLGAAGRDNLYGFGLIQMDAAIRLVLSKPTPTPIPPVTPTFTITATIPVQSPTPTLMHTQVLPESGFAPDRISSLPFQPVIKAYEDLGDLWLEIPQLGVELPIVGVPQVANGWDVSWLGNQAGWLYGTAFPTYAGNSVLSAHVYDAYGKPGPFVKLNTLIWGDQIIVHALGQRSYIYAVRESKLVTPDAVSSVIQHEELPWLTLITCKGYDEDSNSYRYRVVIRAVLVAIK